MPDFPSLGTSPLHLAAVPFRIHRFSISLSLQVDGTSNRADLVLEPVGDSTVYNSARLPLQGYHARPLNSHIFLRHCCSGSRTPTHFFGGVGQHTKYLPLIPILT